MDFYRIVESEPDKKGATSIFPDYTPLGFTDLMIRGGDFYAIWDEENKTWSTDEYDVPRLVDAHLQEHVKLLPELDTGRFTIKWMNSFTSRTWLNFKQFVRSVSDRYTPLDRRLVFLGEVTEKEDYVTKSLPYRLQEGSTDSWDELVSTLYSPLERQKIEWAIGAVISGESRNIQKFLVFYGSAGTGKSTILNVIEKLFEGYFSTFEAKALGSSNGAFSTAAFKHNPLVAIQHDGDLSRIEDNTKLNSIVAHEDILVNEKFMTAFSMKIDSFLFMGTNRPVMITDARSGLSRRLIDVHPTGNLIPPDRYMDIMSQIDFELGAIAAKCLNVYKGLGKSYYNAYRPVEMMAQTDYFYNFVAASYDLFEAQGGVSSAHAWTMFKAFCEEQKIDSKMPQFKFREELKNYFKNFQPRARIDGDWVWGWYSDFDTKRFIQHDLVVNDNVEVFEMDANVSILDEVLEALPAQYGRTDKYGADVPKTRWDHVKTTLKDLNTRDLHYVKIPPNHIVIDFDLKDEHDEKSLELNLEAASKWPKTYAELSKSGQGVHLHYLYDGDTELLKAVYEDGIEVKVFKGNSSLRRRLSKCNDTPIATISSGLPLKEKKMLSDEVMKNERQLRSRIAKALRKEVHDFTKPNVDFIEHVMKEAYESKMVYDVTDMKADIIRFALEASNQSEACLDVVSRMHWRSEEDIFSEVEPTDGPIPIGTDSTLAFYDVEVYPNLFMIRYKLEGDHPLVTMLNPSAQQVSAFMRLRLVGFYCRNYDNHIIYAASLGYSIEALYNLSQALVNNVPNSKFGAAFNLSHVDVYDYASEKMSLKHWEIKLGLKHMEMDIPWDQPVPEDRITDVEEYCGNDVLATEAVHVARQGDYKARLILAALSGLSPNDTNNAHSTAIIFGSNKRPQPAFKYVPLKEEFPGYKFELGKSYYRDEIVGEGGYVDSQPGIYEDVLLLDITSMHPSTIIRLNLFGDVYTAKFKQLLDIRVALKNGDVEKAVAIDPRIKEFVMLNGEPDFAGAKLLADALKIVINSVYGLTSAKFENPFRDPRNKDNIVAKRGALFMLDLKAYLKENYPDYKAVHFKTDSVKIVVPEGGDREMITHAITEFGQIYGYDFEMEATYRKFCLFNDAVYVAKDGDIWIAKGKQMLDPYTFKTLFTGEDIEFNELFETRSLMKGTIYLEFDTQLDVKEGYVPGESARFIGRTGLFVPVREGCGGGLLYRVLDGKATAVPDTKGYFWKESSLAKYDEVDWTFYDKKLDKARAAIDAFGSYEELVK